MEMWGQAQEREGEKSQRQSKEVIRSALEKHNQIGGIVWSGKSLREGGESRMLKSCTLLVVPEPSYMIFHGLKSPRGADVLLVLFSIPVYILLALPYLQQHHSLLL